MAVHITGVSTRIADVEFRAVFVHCLADSLNLAFQESSRGCPVYRDMINYVKDVINLIRASPKRSALLEELQKDSDEHQIKELRPLCSTRWMTRHKSIR